MEVHSLEYMTKMIKANTNRINSNTLDIAQRVCYIKYNELWKESYKSFNEYVKSVLKLSKTTLSDYNKVVYKFCNTDDNSSTGYCVKSLFRDYTFSQLREMSILTEEEIQQLKIDSTLSEKEIRKIVKEYMKVLQGHFNDLAKPEETVKEESFIEETKTYKTYIDDSIFTFFDCDKCNVKDMRKTVSVTTGLNYLKNMIVKDNEHVYMVVKVPKKYLKGDCEE